MDIFPDWVRLPRAGRGTLITRARATVDTTGNAASPRRMIRRPILSVLLKTASIPLLSLSLPATTTSAVELITAKEAKLPDAVPRGITRSPTIRLISPEPGTKPVASPFAFKVSFEPHGGARIDPKTIKVTYLKMPLVDLTKRLAPYISATGIELPDTETPAGLHSMRIVARDSDGRITETIISLRVAR